MSRSITFRATDENWEALQRLIASHDEWLAAAAKSDPAYISGLDKWSASDALNAAMRDFCERAAGDFDHSRKLLKTRAGR